MNLIKKSFTKRHWKCKKKCPKFKHALLLDVNVHPRYNIIMSSILGFVIGDVLGVPVEFESRDEKKRYHLRNACLRDI